MFFCQDVTDNRTRARSAHSLLLMCRDHSTPPLLVSKQGMGSLGFRWSYADNFGFLPSDANCTNVHLARLVAGVKRVGFTTYPLPEELHMFSDMNCHQPICIAMEQASGQDVSP